MARFLWITALSAAFGVTLGCSPAPATTSSGGGGAGGGDGGAGSTGGTGGAATTTSDTFTMEPGMTTLEAEVGLLTIPPGDEAVKCVTVSLGNPEGVFVRRFRTKLNEGSHHMIVYSSTQPPNPTPEPCMSFGVAGGSAIFIAQQAESELVFPTDPSGVPVGLELAPSQSLTLEVHYINPTNEPLDVIGKVELDVVPLSSNVIKSGFAFQGAFDIPEIPPFGEADTGVRFQPGIPGTRVFALTTHQHHLGTRMQVWLADDVSDLSHGIADSTSWSDPPLETYDPALELPVGGSKGFAYQCHWKNPTPDTVYGGLGANDEMCFFWSYHYPTGG